MWIFDISHAAGVHAVVTNSICDTGGNVVDSTPLKLARWLPTTDFALQHNPQKTPSLPQEITPATQRQVPNLWIAATLCQRPSPT